MNKTELENLVAIRIKEADILLAADCYQGAYYLAGYALECALKACIAKQVKEFDFPDKNSPMTVTPTSLLILSLLQG